MTDKWVKRWDVPSASDPDIEYVVAQDAAGDYGCSCPRWKFKRLQCHHIAEVKAGAHALRGEPPKQEPEIALAIVQEVTPELGPDGQPTGRILTPLIPIGDTWFQATVIHDLAKAGVSWATLKARYGVARKNSRDAIMDHVKCRGRRIYGPLHDSKPFRQTYQTIPTERTNDNGL